MMDKDAAKPLISLVIPFYNVEKYIAQCLESIYNQDIAEHLYEVILVNDASPDNSKEIVLAFQKRHSNLILVEHETNKNLGTARNTGRATSKGKYIWNIDSDDYLKPNSLKPLLEICETNQLDILMFNFYHYVDNVERLNTKYPFKESSVYEGIFFINKFCLNSFSEISPVWSQIYNADFLNKNNIYSPEINMGEDGPYTYKSLLLAKRVMSITKSCYVYRANQNSLGGFIEKNPTAIKLYEKCFLFTMHVSQLIKIIPAKEKNIEDRFKSVCKYSISLFPRYLILMNQSELKEFRNLCRTNIITIYSLLKWMNRRNKLLIFSVIFFPILNQKVLSRFVN